MFRSYTEKVYRPDMKTLPPQSPKMQWFSCDICNTDAEDLDSHWRNETDMELHRKQVHFKIIWQQMKDFRHRFCTVCMTLQKSNAELLCHVKHRHLYSSPNAQRIEREIFICDHCNHIFFNKDVLEVHIQFQHMWSGEQRRHNSFVCPKCKRTCLLKSLWYHMQNHEIPSISMCDICLKICPNVMELMAHVKEHPMYYKCEICNYETSKESLFESHLDQHKPNDIKKNTVAINKLIKEAFVSTDPTRRKYNIHHAIKGLGTLPPLIHICVLCREMCTNKAKMLEHLGQHSCLPAQAPSPMFSCACGARYPSRVLLRHHVFKLKGSHREREDSGRVEDESHVRFWEDQTNNISTPEKAQKLRTMETTEKSEQSETRWLVEPTVEIEVDGEPCSVVETEIPIETEIPVEIEIPVETEIPVEIEIPVKTEMPVDREGGSVSRSVSEGGMSESCAGAGDSPTEELMYIYAAVDDEELVTIEQDSEQVIGF